MYCGRFAPSPTGSLHAGSVAAALASWLDARAHGGRWLVRIEDIDPPRCPPGADATILQQLCALGLQPDSDGPCTWQSQRQHLYRQALAQLQQAHLAYPCRCTRKAIRAVWQARLGGAPQRHQALPYPGTCRPPGLVEQQPQPQPPPQEPLTWRFHLQRLLGQLGQQQGQGQQPSEVSKGLSTGYQCSATGRLTWQDRALGWQQQEVLASTGDFVLRRADGLWAYQLAVVVDDGQQGITHIVRGQDLSDNTPGQLLLQTALGLPQPRYWHIPLVRLADGEKLSKQHGAPAADCQRPLATLQAAAHFLGLPSAPSHCQLGDALGFWVQAWHDIYLQSEL